MLTKRTYELLDEQVAQLMEEAPAGRAGGPEQMLHAAIENYMEQALRVIGAWIDEAKARDVFFSSRTAPSSCGCCMRPPEARWATSRPNSRSRRSWL